MSVIGPDKFKPETPQSIAARFFNKTLAQYELDINEMGSRLKDTNLTPASTLHDYLITDWPSLQIKKVIAVFKNALTNKNITADEIKEAGGAVSIEYYSMQLASSRRKKVLENPDEIIAEIQNNRLAAEKVFGIKSADIKITQEDMASQIKMTTADLKSFQFSAKALAAVYSELAALAKTQSISLPALSSVSSPSP